MKIININKKIISVILIIALILLLSTLTYAKPFTDAFTGGLTQINDFFANEQYKAYTTAIDFFFFALLFISVYMIGVRYAFKEVKKPEKVIAILLGLMTAFLLVLGGFSATILLPYIHWLLYTLLFIFYWWLLKGIKSKFWRFILALLLTLLTIGLIQGLFDALSPDTEGFFSSLSKSFASIQFPETPGVPDYLTDLFGAQVAAPTGPDLTTLPSATTPVEEKRGQGWLPGGYSAGHLLWIIPLLVALSYGGFRLFRRVRGERRQASTIINEIDEIINRKTAKMNEVKQANQEKNQMIQMAENRMAVIEKLQDPAYAWEAVRGIEEGHPLKDLYNKELQLIIKLKELIDLEKTEFLDSKLNNWQERIMRETGIDDASKQRILQQLEELRNLITYKPTIRDIRNMGILWLIVICYDYEKREAKLNKELDQLLQEHNVEELIRDKFAKVKEDNTKLHHYNAMEVGIINKLLNQKIELQKSKLEELKRIISGLTPTAQPRPEAPAPTPQPESPYEEPVYPEVEEEIGKLKELNEEVKTLEILRESRKTIEEEISQDIYELLKTEEISASPDADKIVDEAKKISKVSRFRGLWDSLAEYLSRTRNVKVGISNFTRVILTNIRERRKRIEEFVNGIKARTKKTKTPVQKTQAEDITKLLGIDERELEAQGRIRFRGR